MASLYADQVFTGFWVDQTHGNILGATLTMTSSSANIVVAMLSLVVAFAGSHLWDIIAYSIFMVSTPKPGKSANAVTHQKRFLLRNVPSPGAIAVAFAKMCWHWRKVAPQAQIDQSLIAMLAGLCSIGFLVAGILSSLVVTSAAIDVLVSSSTCGYPAWNLSALSSAQLGLLGSWQATSVRQSLSYARNCANGTSSNPQCQIYATQSIPFNTTYSQCPFPGNVCVLPYNQAITMDTGFMDSNDVFGINAKRDDRVLLRRKITCAPIDGITHSEKFNITPQIAELVFNRPAFPKEEGIRYYWGNNSVGNGWNYTLTQSLVQRDYTGVYQALEVNYYPPSNTNTSLQSRLAPESDILRQDADTVLIAISSNGIIFDGPIEDPIFSAHRTQQRQIGDGMFVNRTVYLGDLPSAWIGCVDQQQYCLPQGSCTDLANINKINDQIRSIGMNPKQNATFVDLLPAGTDMTWVGRIGATPPLLANDQATGGLQAALPPDQWEIEVRGWMSWILAAQQRAICDTAMGPGVTGAAFASIPTAMGDPEELSLCHAQKMKAPTGISNVSVFGLGFIVATCGLIILTNTLLTNIMKWLSRSNRIRSLGMEQWDGEALLQVQRKAFELQGLGQWIGNSREVPVTKASEAWLYASNSAGSAHFSTTNGSNGVSGLSGTSPNVTITQASSDMPQVRAPERVKTM